MQYQKLLNHKKEILNIFKQYGVTNPRVFGSTVSGVAHSQSDIDFLITWPAKHNLLDRIELKSSLEDLLHQKVDLVVDKTLHPLIRSQVLESAKPL